MKSLNLKKLVAMALTLVTVTAVSPVAASAAWKQDAKGWWNTEGNSWSIGWRQIDGTWYHFDETGYMSTGWINDNGTWYFAEGSGAMLTGVIKVDGQTYYLQSNGAMATGEVEINGVKYTFGTNGACIGDAPKADKVFGTTDSGNNSGSSNTDKDTDSDSGSSGGSSHGGGGSSSSTPAAIKDYSTSANITVENVSDKEADVDTYKIAFKNTLTKSKDGDYVVRDLYVTNEDAIISEEDGGYLVEVKKGSTLDAKGIIRVVRDGKVYYATGIAITK